MIERRDRDNLKVDGFYDFATEKWPTVLPFLVGGYNLDSAKCQTGQKAADNTAGKRTRSLKYIEQVSADFIHSIRILIRECTDIAALDKGCDGEPLAGSMIVPDGDGHAAVPFCQHLPTALHVSHRCGVPAVHLRDHKDRVNFEKLGKEIGATGNASLGKNEARLAKERFETLAKFVQEQHRICLQDRYQLPPDQLPPPDRLLGDAGPPEPDATPDSKGTKHSTDAGEGGLRKSRRALGHPALEAKTDAIRT